MKGTDGDDQIVFDPDWLRNEDGDMLNADACFQIKELWKRWQGDGDFAMGIESNIKDYLERNPADSHYCRDALRFTCTHGSLCDKLHPTVEQIMVILLQSSIRFPDPDKEKSGMVATRTGAVCSHYIAGTLKGCDKTAYMCMCLKSTKYSIKHVCPYFHWDTLPHMRRCKGFWKQANGGAQIKDHSLM